MVPLKTLNLNSEEIKAHQGHATRMDEFNERHISQLLEPTIG